ncbi:MAG: hypothetical protein ACE5HX_04210 [bacterium]
MMKQLTIYCSAELEPDVSQIFHKYEIDGFIHIPGIYGNKLKPRGSLEKDQIWPASGFVLHTDELNIRGIIQDLQNYANKCDIQPCLRMVVTPVEKCI